MTIESVLSVENTKLVEDNYIFLRLFQDYYPPGFLKKVFAEIIATYQLVFVTCGSAALSENDENEVGKLGASVAGGLIVTVMIYAVGHISGAHMNPAVTLAFAAVRHLPWKYSVVPLPTTDTQVGISVPLPTTDTQVGISVRVHVPMYAIGQLTGALSAAFTLRIMLHPIKNLGTTTPSGTDTQALVMQIVVTFTMMFIASAVSTDTTAVGELGGVAVGSAVCITSILAGPVSGGSMNPARTIGPAVASSNYKGLWVYIAGPVTGTLLGALSYDLIRATNKPLHSASSQTLSTEQR